MQHSSLVAASLLCVACGARAPGPAAEPRGDGAVAAEQGEGPAGAETGAADADAGKREPDAGAAIPASEADCVEFHARMRECARAGSAGGLGPGDEAGMRDEAEQGCLTAVADRDNPITGHVLGLWARCKDLPCAEMEACVQAGMSEISAPPGPYVTPPR